jgi:dTDP-D-glucose 4,6-dehydratase
MAKLKVGDRVYEIGSKNQINHLHVIERVTKTMAFSKTERFRIDYSELGVNPVGERSWSHVHYLIETPELKAKLIKQRAVKKIKDTDFSVLSDFQLKQILEIINL